MMRMSRDDDYDDDDGVRTEYLRNEYLQVFVPGIIIIIIIIIAIIIIIDHHANLFQALNQFRHNCTPTWLFIASGLKFCGAKKKITF